LMMTLDESGVERSFLSSEERFATVKALYSKNLIVPTVGDFAGPKALRAIADYLKAHGATLSAFYVSNVEQYLQQNGVWQSFCSNVATMPIDESSVYIRPSGIGVVRPVGGQTPPITRVPGPLMPVAAEVAANNCAGK